MITAKDLLEITKKSAGSAYQEANKLLKKEEPCLIAAAEAGRRFYRLNLRNYYSMSSKSEINEALTELVEELGFEITITESTGNCIIEW